MTKIYLTCKLYQTAKLLETKNSIILLLPYITHKAFMHRLSYYVIHVTCFVAYKCEFVGDWNNYSMHATVVPTVVVDLSRLNTDFWWALGFAWHWKFPPLNWTQGLYSLSGKTSYCQISWSLDAARLDVAMVVSLWNLTGTSAAVLPKYLPNFRAIGKVWTWISRLRDFARSCGKTSHRLVNRGPECTDNHQGSNSWSKPATGPAYNVGLDNQGCVTVSDLLPFMNRDNQCDYIVMI